MLLPPTIPNLPFIPIFHFSNTFLQKIMGCRKEMKTISENVFLLAKQIVPLGSPSVKLFANIVISLFVFGWVMSHCEHLFSFPTCFLSCLNLLGVRSKEPLVRFNRNQQKMKWNMNLSQWVFQNLKMFR